MRVSQAYFNQPTAAEAVKAAQGNGKAIAEQLASVRHNFEKGNAPITDIREAEARADLARSQQIVADSELFLNTLAFDQVVGRTGVVPHSLRSPMTLPPMLPSQMSNWVTMAEVPDGSFAGNGASTGVNVTLSVPLFSGFAIQNRVNEASALQLKAQAALEGAHNLVVTDVRTAFANVLTQAAQIQALQAAEASSKLALDATVFSYRAGVKLNLDVLNAQSQVYLSQRDVAAARYQYLLATLKLRQASGTLTVNDLQPIDHLLSRVDREAPGADLPRFTP